MKKAQLSIPIHWIYVLVAGGIILLFFIGIVVKQQSVAEKDLSITVINKFEGIFTGAAASDQARNIVDIPELDISFTCDDTGYSEYRVGKDGVGRSIPYQPLFGPSNVRTSQLITWTLQFNMPFNAINFVMVGTPSIDYILIHNNQAEVSEIEDTFPSEFNLRSFTQEQFNREEPKAQFVKLIFLQDLTSLPPHFTGLDDENVHAVKIGAGRTTATFYKKDGSQLKVDKQGNAAAIVRNTLGINPSLYAAFFSDDTITYQCNVAKALQRVQYLADIYKERTTILYDKLLRQQERANGCDLLLINIAELFTDLKEDAKKCADNPFACGTFSETAKKISEKNTVMQNNNCPLLY
jgi:hypothetical protein